jgi:serine phosphatase RsbU (regulator of sigma subunit)
MAEAKLACIGGIRGEHRHGGEGVSVPTGPLGGGRRFGSLETKLATVTTLVLVLVSATLFVELAVRERAKLISAKTSAASMLIQLLSTELAAAIDFGDADDVSTRLNDLRGNPDIVGAAVWADSSSPPAALWAVPDSPPMTAPGPRDADGAVATSDWLTATKTIIGPRGTSLGRVRVVFTLHPENDAFRKNSLQLFWMTAALAATAALLLALFARRYVVGPLTRLAHAASALADGDVSVRVDVRSNDEIGDLARAFNIMGKAVAFREERLHKEIELAQHLQTSILPRALAVPGMDIAAKMIPTSKVGGDYYDILPVADGCWIGIGDVAGHGLDAGLMMLMMQSIVASLVARDPATLPKEIVCVLNEVLFDNIRNRLQRDDHATLTILHYERSGNITFAGAHEEIIVYRAAERRCEVVRTPGTWVGGRRDIRPGTVDSTLTLHGGDVLLLHTDGVTETRNPRGQEFGIDRLCAAFESVADRTVVEIQEQLLLSVGAWGEAEDDVTFLVLRFTGA